MSVIWIHYLEEAVNVRWGFNSSSHDKSSNCQIVQFYKKIGKNFYCIEKLIYVKDGKKMEVQCYLEAQEWSILADQEFYSVVPLSPEAHTLRSCAWKNS